MKFKTSRIAQIGRNSFGTLFVLAAMFQVIPGASDSCAAKAQGGLGVFIPRTGTDIDAAAANMVPDPTTYIVEHGT